MSFNTVGEIIKALQEFDASTPVLKLDLATDTYCDIDLTAPLLFRVRPDVDADGNDIYTDAVRTDAKGFDAIVL